jgi:hypothetical protein
MTAVGSRFWLPAGTRTAATCGVTSPAAYRKAMR